MLLIAAAAFVADWWKSGQRLVFIRRFRFAGIAAVCLLVLAGVKLGTGTRTQFMSLAANEQAYNGHYESVAAWMNQNVPPGETVFHANWSDSQFFIGLSPQHDYFVTLDPIYMYYWDRQKYNLYRDIAFGRAPDPYAALKDTFGVRYGYAGKDYFGGLADQVKADSRFQVMGEDSWGIFFMLK